MNFYHEVTSLYSVCNFHRIFWDFHFSKPVWLWADISNSGWKKNAYVNQNKIRHLSIVSNIAAVPSTYQLYTAIWAMARRYMSHKSSLSDLTFSDLFSAWGNPGINPYYWPGVWIRKSCDKSGERTIIHTNGDFAHLMTQAPSIITPSVSRGNLTHGLPRFINAIYVSTNLERSSHEQIPSGWVQTLLTSATRTYSVPNTMVVSRSTSYMVEINTQLLI